MGRELKKCIKNYQNYIYQFHYIGNALAVFVFYRELPCVVVF
jgi:hypothetical protein